jgi:hypothetical protein
MPFSKIPNLCPFNILFHHAKCEAYVCDTLQPFPSPQRMWLRVWNFMPFRGLYILRLGGCHKCLSFHSWQLRHVEWLHDTRWRKHMVFGKEQEGKMYICWLSYKEWREYKNGWPPYTICSTTCTTSIWVLSNQPTWLETCPTLTKEIANLAQW